jgi:hypothetical protein
MLVMVTLAWMVESIAEREPEREGLMLELG